jgi:UDP-3-O-[3-hydroxymyristoyl] N-acetylglucosamine deacetylase
MIQTTRSQNTLKGTAAFSGIGIHTGREVNMRFLPAPEGHGIVFKRIDLEGAPLLPASVDCVCDLLRSTTIGQGDIKIHTVEHVLAALHAYHIDNLLIEIDSIEPPVGNGSSDVFVEMIEKAGILKQAAPAYYFKLEKPIYWADKDIQVMALPYDGFRISYTLNYPGSKILKAQFHTVDITPENFKKEIASCRTFSLYEEVSMLLDRGLIKGASLDNAVVIKEDVVLSKNGLFFPDEMVRHKILDVVGDLKLIGTDIHAHIISIRSGHASNHEFAKLLKQAITETSAL